MTEKIFERKLLTALTHQGIYARHTEVLQQPGWPDVLCIHGDNFLFLELKIIDSMTRLRKNLQPSQTPWLLNFLDFSGKIFFIFKVGESEEYYMGQVNKLMLRAIRDNALSKDNYSTFGFKKLKGLAPVIDRIKKELQK